jgi:serpin B
VLVTVVATGCGTAPTPATTITPAPTPPMAATPAASSTPAEEPTAAPPPSTGPAGIVLASADVPRPVPTGDPVIAASAVNAFGLDLYKRLASTGDNLVVSPTSIALALAMARFGARGETAAQMDDVQRRLGADGMADALNALDQALATRSGTFTDVEGNRLSTVLRMVSSAFAQSGYPLEPAYLDALAARLGAALRLVDFIGDPGRARSLINDWVNRWTEERIPELLGPTDVDQLTRLVLVNAIYLKAAWTSTFDPADTKTRDFTRLDGSTVAVPMMSLVGTNTGPTFPCAAGDGWRAIELPFLGERTRSPGTADDPWAGHWSDGSLAMTVIVPDDLAAFEKTLGPATLAALESSFAEGADCKVDLRLPRFGVDTSVQLADVLKAMGMPLAFDPDAADFGGITTADQLYIARVIHQANIDVDEKGAEAAAATAVVMATAGPGDTREPVRIWADQPFVFLVRDVPTGAILFMGRVTDPS